MPKGFAQHQDNAALVLLGAIWGASYLFIRVAVPVFGPFGLSFVRVAIGSLGLLAFVLLTFGRPGLPKLSQAFFALAVINSVLPFALINYAELHITASLASILNATTPLFAAIIVTTIHRSRPTTALLGGLLMGVCGVAILVGWSPLPMSAGVGLAIAAMLAASFSYAGGSVYAKARLGTVSTHQLALGQQISALILMTPLMLGSVANGSTDTSPGVKPALAAVALGLICTSFAYLLYFHLIRSVGPVRTSLVTFLIPVFGIFWSWLFLDETIKPIMLVGLVLILASVRLVNRPPKETTEVKRSEHVAPTPRGRRV